MNRAEENTKGTALISSPDDGMRLLIFTDLDGTLLDFDTYSFRGALDILSRLTKRVIPVIPVTSKTRAETAVIHAKLSLTGPYIYENGGGIFWSDPPGAALENSDYPPVLTRKGVRFPLSKSHDHVRRALERYRKTVPLRHLSGMSIKEIRSHTGLSAREAAQARIREHSEPFLLDDHAQLPMLTDMAGADGYRILKGGRFLHLMEAGCDKGHAVRLLLEWYRAHHGAEFRTIGLGDSHNDFDMLRSVDVPVIIPRPDGSRADLEHPGLRVAPDHGCRGWAAIVKMLVEEHQSGSLYSGRQVPGRGGGMRHE